jgi:hypothetical protein
MLAAFHIETPPMTLKHMLLAVLLLAAPLTQAADASTQPAPKTVTGEVLEAKDVDIYTYLRLKTKDGERWAAVSQSAVKKGSKVTIRNVMVMENFESKALKKTFPLILFGNLGNAGDAAAADPHAGLGAAKPADSAPIKLAKASGANAYSVFEVFAQATKLKDKPVRVSGKVVKVNDGIMGKNWLHLQDGTGAAGTNDILVTSAATAKVGDVVTAVGTLRTDRDFGAGYTYKVLIEEAELKP